MKGDYIKMSRLNISIPKDFSRNNIITIEDLVDTIVDEGNKDGLHLAMISDLETLQAEFNSKLEDGSSLFVVFNDFKEELGQSNISKKADICLSSLPGNNDNILKEVKKSFEYNGYTVSVDKYGDKDHIHIDINKAVYDEEDRVIYGAIEKLRLVIKEVVKSIGEIVQIKSQAIDQDN